MALEFEGELELELEEPSTATVLHVGTLTILHW